MSAAWKVRDANVRLQETLSEALGVTPVFAQLLLNRNIRTPEQAKEFLFGDLESCHDPFLMKDMDRAVERIGRAIEAREKILVYGDFDVDGVTSTALLSSVLRDLGADCETFIPNRLEDGYGLNIRAVARAHKHGVKLLVTVDCGINSVEEVKCAKDHGIDVIVTDHHEVKGDSRPDAYAVIDPHQPECKYPFKCLAGVAVAYKLARALTKGREEIADKHLDLVALGTIADVVPLEGENRILAKSGLKKLKNTKKAGLLALMDVAGVEPEKVTCRHIGFALGPRINAMGRVGSADGALDLILSDDREKAAEMARTLDKENLNRRAIEKDIAEQASQRVKDEIDLENTNVIVLADEAWHVGVVGIVASRLTEEFGKPAILIVLDGEKGKGSGRGVKGFDLFGAVDKASEHLLDFGGHEAACGVRIERDKIDAFRQSVNKAALTSYISTEETDGELDIDLNLPFSRVGVKLINELSLLMPYGPDNSEPVFSTNGIKVKNNPRDIGKSGFKFLATCGNLTCEAITFRKKQVTRPRPGDIIDLAYTPSINSWGGIDSIQLNIRDLNIVN